MSWPTTDAARDRFVLERRGPRSEPDPWQYQNLVVEDERAADGSRARVATIFLTGRECPWRCVMCDLWTHTTTTDTPLGAIPAQVMAARQVLGAELPSITQIKLYNAGSFFDPRAVPEGDYDSIATLLQGFERVILESHPSLVGRRVDRFLDALERHRLPGAPLCSLEVAMGLETAHPLALERLHKHMTVESFVEAGARLKARGVALRVFLLISPPFVGPHEQEVWLLRSIDLAFACGATAISLIPTRAGNGALDLLAQEGLFRTARLAEIEQSVEVAQAHAVGRGRIFVDLWEISRFTDCVHCCAARRARLHRMNLEQRSLPSVVCRHCSVVDQ